MRSVARSFQIGILLLDLLAAKASHKLQCAAPRILSYLHGLPGLLLQGEVKFRHLGGRRKPQPVGNGPTALRSKEKACLLHLHFLAGERGLQLRKLHGLRLAQSETARAGTADDSG